MTDRTPKFAPMSWAIMVTDIGGRPLQVETTTWTLMGTERVHEYYVQPGDTKTRYQLYPDDLGYHVDNLIPVASEWEARVGSRYLKDVYEQGAAAVSEAKQAQSRALRVAQEALRRDLAGTINPAPK